MVQYDKKILSFECTHPCATKTLLLVVRVAFRLGLHGFGHGNFERLHHAHNSDPPLPPNNPPTW